MKSGRLLLLGLLLWSFSGYGQPPRVVLRDTAALVLLGDRAEYLEDQTRLLNIVEVQQAGKDGKFRSIGADVFSRPASEAAIWFRLRISNQTGKDLWLEIGDTFGTMYADFYAPNAEGRYQTARKLGAMRPQENKEFPANTYCVRLADRSDTTTRTYYVRVSGSAPKTHVLQAGTTLALSAHASKLHAARAGFVGVVLAMMLYNLFLLYSIRDRIYLIYILYLTSVLFNIPFLNGNPLVHIPWLWENFFLWHNIIHLFMFLFATQYLELRKFAPRLMRWLGFVTLLLVVGFPLGSTFVGLTPLTNPFQVVSLAYYFSLLAAGIYAWRKGHKNARFYVLAWFFVIGSVFLFVLTINGIIPFNDFSHNIMYIGFGTETLLFALALGDRYNELKREKEAAQLKNLSLVRQQNEVLEQKVQERTQALSASREKVMQQNEELLQTQDELARQQRSLDAQNQQLNAQNRKIATSIRAAQTIQRAFLPPEKELRAQLGEYFILDRPRDVVSGDFYRLDEVAGQTLMIVADCTGHGVPGAFMTLIANNILDKLLHTEHIQDPAQLLARLDADINRALRQSESANNNSGLEAVVLAFSQNPENQQLDLHFAGARNKLFYRLPDGETLSEIRGTRRAVGGKQRSQRPFETHRLQLPKGTMIYAGSDGIQDQNNAKRQKFGSLRFKALLYELSDLPPSVQQERLEETLDRFMEGTEQRDDMLWVGFRV